MHTPKTKVVPEMRRAYEKVGFAGRWIDTPTGNYNVTIRKNGAIVCTSSMEYMADIIAAMIDNHKDEFNKLLNDTRDPKND